MIYFLFCLIVLANISLISLIRLASFATSWKESQLVKERLRRKQCKADHSVIFENGSFTPKLISVLKEIFSQYETNGRNWLTQVEASRLWYRCGIKLSSLKDIFADDRSTKDITFDDFFNLLQRIIADDERHYPIELSDDADDSSDFEVRPFNAI